MTVAQVTQVMLRTASAVAPIARVTQALVRVASAYVAPVSPVPLRNSLAMRLLVPNPVGFADLVSSSIAETDHAEWSAGAAYDVGDRRIVVAEHRVYESLQAGNTAHPPATSPDWWADVGPTNRWAMFDMASSVGSSASTSMSVVILTGAINDVSFVGLAAEAITITGAGVSVSRPVPVPTAPSTTVTIVVDDIGFAGGELTITITGPGPISVQNIVVGTSLDIGEAQHGLTVGITDYSAKRVDDFGNISVQRRGYSRRINTRVAIPIGDVDAVAEALAGVRTTLCVWQVHRQYQQLTIFGYFTDWSIDLSFSTLAFASITLESKLISDAGPVKDLVADNSINFAKLQDLSATALVIGRKSAGGGDPEEVSLTELLDFIGSAAHGDMLYRGAGAWSRLPAGANGRGLRARGAAAPTWDEQPAIAVFTYPGTPAAGALMMIYPAPAGIAMVTFAAALAGSSGKALTAATAQTDFDVRKNATSTATGTSVGTIRFAAAGTVPTFIAASAFTLAGGTDWLTVWAPAVPDATLSNISAALFAARS